MRVTVGDRRRADNRSISAQRLSHRGPLVAALLVALAALVERRALGRRMRRHEEQLRRLAQTSNDLLWTLDRDLRYVEVSGPSERIVGWTPTELIGRPLLEGVEASRRDSDEAMLRDVLAGGVVRGHESRRVRRDGAVIDVTVNIVPVCDDRGAIVGCTGTTTDISDRRATERRYRDSEQRLAEAQRIAGVGSWELDPATGEFACSEETLRLLAIGSVTDVVTWDSFLESIGPEDRDRVTHATAAALREGDGFEEEFTIVRRDGARRFVRVRAEFDRDAGGRLVRVRGTTLDLTERRRAEQRYRDIVDTAHDVIWSADGDGIVTFANPAAETVLGYRPEEMVGRRVLDFAAPEEREAAAAAIRAVAGGGALSLYETRLLHADGHCVDVCINVVGHPDGRLLGTTADVTERKRAMRELEAARERFAKAFEHAPIGMALVTLDARRGTRLERVNDATCRILGRGEDELVGRWTDAVGVVPAEGESDMVARLLEGEISRYRVEQEVRRPDGARAWLALSVSAVRDAEDGDTYGVAQIEDVTERREYQERLQHLADHDALTGLANRRRFEEDLRRQLVYAGRYDEAGAILVLDLDSFKYANDSFGHQAGDAVIRGVAELLRARLRESDTLARLGGDEFAVLLPRADRGGAEQVASDLLDALRATPIVIDERTGQLVHLTASLGIALFQRTDMSHDDLLALADMAMYQAKDAGRDGFAVYDADGDHQAVMAERVVVMQRIREALHADDGFTLYAQPIIDLQSGRATHQEVLLRLRDRDGTIVPPGAFIPIAEAFGLMGAVDRWVVRHAIELAERQQATGEDVRLEINLSAQSLGDMTFPALVEQELARSGVDPARLIFEVTETAAISNFHNARAFIERLRAVGCAFALDDFGAGYGSFRYLKHLPFDLLKIDGDFIRELPSSPRDQVIVRALVEAAQALGKRTVAEFVSDDATVALLREWGVDYGQGFHLAEPAPVAVAPRVPPALSSHRA